MTVNVLWFEDASLCTLQEILNRIECYDTLTLKFLLRWTEGNLPAEFSESYFEDTED